jgi:NADPH-ferrihemoprotein reductase
MSVANRTTFQAIPLAFHWSTMSSTSTSDVVILALGVTLAAAYLFRDQLFAASKPKAAPLSSNANKIANGGGNPRDFIAKMKEGVSSMRFPPALPLQR